MAAETWRRDRGEIRNPGGYLNTLCEILVIHWYVPPEERQKRAQETRRRQEMQTAGLVVQQQIQEVEIKNLRILLRQARKESFDQMMKSGERGKQIAILERKIEFQQRELFSARAKMKRLVAKKQRKSVDHTPWPEYSDDTGAHRGALSDDTRIGPQSRTSCGRSAQLT